MIYSIGPSMPICFRLENTDIQSIPFPKQTIIIIGSSNTMHLTQGLGSLREPSLSKKSSLRDANEIDRRLLANPTQKVTLMASDS